MDTSALIKEVNSKPHLFKAYATSDSSEVPQRFRLTIGINLSGGVALEHVRSQIYEFLDDIQRLDTRI
jgi:hypothetical protein